jgi:4-hydroxy-4-methyl-2-oxoglutarate aldolase
MKPVVVRNIKRADSNAIGTLGAVGVSTAHEALGRSGLMKPYMRPIWTGAQIAGPAVTVLAQPGDNWMIHVAVEQCQKGDVLVVGCTADNSDGMFGELLATALRESHFGKRHRESHAWCGQRSGRLRRRQR